MTNRISQIRSLQPIRMSRLLCKGWGCSVLRQKVTKRIPQMLCFLSKAHEGSVLRQKLTNRIPEELFFCQSACAGAQRAHTRPQASAAAPFP
jgi:hypothetical protein